MPKQTEAKQPTGPKPDQTMFEYMRERCDLACTYAEDGAYTRAAEILRDIAMETGHHANRVRAMFDGLPKTER